MSSRKQEMPDILGDILGGGRPTQAPVSEPEILSASAAPGEWEYREVIFRDYRGWRARAVNGVELGDWKNAPTIVEYLQQAGSEGWELVSMGERHNNHKEAYFKRPKPQ
jgi:hypothetical protein